MEHKSGTALRRADRRAQRKKGSQAQDGPPVFGSYLSKGRVRWLRNKGRARTKVTTRLADLQELFKKLFSRGKRRDPWSVGA